MQVRKILLSCFTEEEVESQGAGDSPKVTHIISGRTGPGTQQEGEELLRTLEPQPKALSEGQLELGIVAHVFNPST
jgi:hypothetical protein